MQVCVHICCLFSVLRRRLHTLRSSKLTPASHVCVIVRRGCARFEINLQELRDSVAGDVKMRGARRVVAFCLLTAAIPMMLIIIPLYLRSSVFAELHFPMLESDVLPLDEGLSNIFCQVDQPKFQMKCLLPSSVLFSVRFSNKSVLTPVFQLLSV
jgi:hypothetical protein